MLILVGVTVTTAINGGLFESARKAAKGTSFEKDKEHLTAAIATACDVETGIIKKDELEKALNDWEITQNDDGSYIAKSPNKNSYKITPSGIILEENTLSYIYCYKENCQEETHLHKGDYVSYTPTTAQEYKPDGDKAGTYTGYTNSVQSIKQESLNWRVLGQDDKGNILLISGAPTITALSFKGYVGYNNYETVLNDICKALYSNTNLGAVARSITMTDIDTYLGGNKYDKTTYGGEGNLDYGTKNSFNSIFDYDIINNKLTKLNERRKIEITSKDYSYLATNSLIGDKNKEILLSEFNKNAGEVGYASYYNFVAERSVGYGEWNISYIAAGQVFAGWPLCNWKGEEFDLSLCLRPVIILPASTSMKDVNKSNQTTPETWSDPLNMYEG